MSMLRMKDELPEEDENPYADSLCYKKPHFIEPTFMGPDTAKEIVHAWYTAVSLDGCVAVPSVDWSEIERAVCRDVFHVGLTGADVLRELHVEFDMDDFEPLGPEKEIENDVQIALNQLLLIKNKAKFDLGIRLSQRKIRLNFWPYAFAQLRPILEAFEKEGADVKVNWRYDVEDEHVTLALNDLIKSHGPEWKKDVIDYFDNTGIHGHHQLYADEDRSDFDPEDYSSTDEDEDDEDYEHEYDWEDEHDYDPTDIMGGQCGCQGCLVLASYS